MMALSRFRVENFICLCNLSKIELANEIKQSIGIQKETLIEESRWKNFWHATVTAYIWKKIVATTKIRYDISLYIVM